MTFLQVEFLVVLCDHNWQELIQILFGRDFTSIPGLERINGLAEVYFKTKGIAKERQGWRVCYLQRYLQDALNSHQIVLSKVTSCTSSEGTDIQRIILILFIAPCIYRTACSVRTVFKPVDYVINKI